MIPVNKNLALYCDEREARLVYAVLDNLSKAFHVKFPTVEMMLYSAGHMWVGAGQPERGWLTGDGWIMYFYPDPVTNGTAAKLSVDPEAMTEWLEDA